MGYREVFEGFRELLLGVESRRRLIDKEGDFDDIVSTSRDNWVLRLVGDRCTTISRQ